MLQALLLVALSAGAARAQSPGLPASPAALIERVFTLEDAQRLALLNDQRLLSAEQDTIIAGQRVKEARFLFLPEFGLQGSATKFDARYPFSLTGESRNILLFPGTPENIYSGRGYMHLSLYEGRRHVNTLELAHAAHKQALTNYDSVRREVLLGAKEAFVRLILAQERLKAADSYETACEEAVRGVSERWERVEAEALLGEARSQSAEARHELDFSRLAFLKSMNVELDTSFRVQGELKSEPAAVDIEKAVLWAMELRPELQSQAYKAQMDAISVNLAIGRRNPTVFLAGDYELTAQRFPLKQNNWDATLGIKIPISYDFWTQLKQRKAEQRQGELRRAELQDRVRLEVRQAYQNLQHWQREWPRREAHFRRAKTLFDEAVAAKTGGTLARVRAQAGLARLHLSYLASVAEHFLARAKLEWAVGREISR